MSSVRSSRAPGRSFLVGRRLVALVGLLALAAMRLAGAAEFSLTPTRVELTPGRTAETLQLGNQEDQALAFEVEVKRWTMAPDGQWRTEDSDELVVHPLMLRIAAGDKARLRVGTLLPAAEVERAYRVELQQLPSERQAQGVQLTILTRISVPVFVSPAQPRRALALADARIQADTLTWGLVNDGNVRLDPQEARLRVLDAGGALLHSDHVAVGYVLAGARLPLSRPVPPAVCARAARFELELPQAAQTLRAELPPASRRCAG